MPEESERLHLELHHIDRRPLSAGLDEVLLETSEGVIQCRLHPAPGSTCGVIWVGGVGGGLDGPAGGLYPRLAKHLVGDRIASLRLAYRRPTSFPASVLDTLMGTVYLESLGYRELVLVGHSFGGAVVITSAANTQSVVGVVTLSSQTAGTGPVVEFNQIPILIIHGTADTVLPDSCSRQIYSGANDPKQIILYPGCGHGLDECREELDRDLLTWLRQTLLRE